MSWKKKVDTWRIDSCYWRYLIFYFFHFWGWVKARILKFAFVGIVIFGGGLRQEYRKFAFVGIVIFGGGLRQEYWKFSFVDFCCFWGWVVARILIIYICWFLLFLGVGCGEGVVMARILKYQCCHFCGCDYGENIEMFELGFL